MRPHRGRAGAHRGTRDDLEGTPHPQRDAPSLRDPDAGAVRPVLLGDLKPGLVVRPTLPVGPGPSARHQRPHSPGLENGYVEVNKQIARKVVDVARGLPGRPLVMVHDYQLYLVPKLV